MGKLHTNLGGYLKLSFSNLQALLGVTLCTFIMVDMSNIKILGYFKLSFMMAEMDDLGINLERYFKLSFIIIDMVYLDANLRIVLNYLQ